MRVLRFNPYKFAIPKIVIVRIVLFISVFGRDINRGFVATNHIIYIYAASINSRYDSSNNTAFKK